MANDVKLMANEAIETTGDTSSRSSQTKAKNKGKQRQNKADNVPQKLTLVNLQNEAKQLDEFKEVSLLDGKYTVNVRQKFLPSKIQQFILDVKEALLILKSENASLQDLNRVFIIFNMCLFQNFTDLPLNHLSLGKKRNISKLLDVAEQLMDLGIFMELLQAFDVNEMTKLNDMVKQTETLGKDLGEIMISATLNEQEKLRKFGLEFVGDSDVDPNNESEDLTDGI